MDFWKGKGTKKRGGKRRTKKKDKKNKEKDKKNKNKKKTHTSASGVRLLTSWGELLNSTLNI